MRDLLNEVALTMIPGLGCSSVRQLLDIVGDAKTLFSLSKKDLSQIFGKRKEIIDAVADKQTMDDAEKELLFDEKHNIKVLYYTDRDFPQRLNREGCSDTPVVLYQMGNSDLNAERIVCVVGTRKSTDYGRDVTARLISDLKNEGVCVVSGLALGIDAAAHEASLANNIPTVAVLAHGLDRIYPSQNRNLAKKILGNGSLVTEMRSGTAIMPGLFPARNRIIAAMSDATIVVEASKKGGALITANLANGYHRDLFAVPGRVGDKYSEGCNAIIASCKAQLIRNADDLMNNMGWERRSKHESKQTELFVELHGDEKTVYDIIDQHEGITLEEIGLHCGLSLPKIATSLLSLELKNMCRCLPGKRYKAL